MRLSMLRGIGMWIRAGLLGWVVVTLSACQSNTMLPDKHQARVFGAKARAVSAAMASLQAALQREGAGGALVRVEVKKSESRVQILRMGMSAQGAAIDATKSRQPLCNDASVAETLFFIYPAAAALPIRHYDCNELQAEALARIAQENRLAQLQKDLSEAEEALTRAQRELAEAQRLLVLDIKMNLTQQALIERAGTLAITNASGMKDLVERVEILAASVKAQAEMTQAFIKTANEKLTLVEAATKKL